MHDKACFWLLFLLILISLCQAACLWLINTKAIQPTMPAMSSASRRTVIRHAPKLALHDQVPCAHLATIQFNHSVQPFSTPETSSWLLPSRPALRERVKGLGDFVLRTCGQRYQWSLEVYVGYTMLWTPKMDGLLQSTVNIFEKPPYTYSFYICICWHLFNSTWYIRVTDAYGWSIIIVATLDISN